MVSGWGLGYKYKGLRVGLKLLEAFHQKCCATCSSKPVVLDFHLELISLKEKGVILS